MGTRIQKPLFLILFTLIAIWWGCTVLVDFVIVKTIFSTIGDFFLAGKLGMTLFAKFNLLEIIIGSIVFVLQILLIRINKNMIPLGILSFISLVIVIVYFSYLTPKLIYLSELWEQSELTGTQSFGGIADIQQEHQLYHRLYIGLDSVKLILLSLFLSLGIWKYEKWI